MRELELDSRKHTVVKDKSREQELITWFKTDYVQRLLRIQRYTYLGLPLPETRYALEHEAYEKENELRVLKGLEKLPKLKINDIL